MSILNFTCDHHVRYLVNHYCRRSIMGNFHFISIEITQHPPLIVRNWLTPLPPEYCCHFSWPPTYLQNTGVPAKYGWIGALLSPGEEKREICTVAQSTRPPDKALAPIFHLFLSEMKLSFREQRVPRDTVAVPHRPLHPRRFPLRPQERLPWRGG